ncbi:MAG: electron transfer flavoprotein subunit alpha/FixB family protein [bacterium]|nr:electron transfer flavoprotein subunit alpha/FixB family protein [bacterium]
MSKETWVVCEVKDGEIKRVALEIIGKLAETNVGDVAAVIIGGSDNATSGLNGYPVSKVYSIEATALANYTTLGYTKALADLINEKQPGTVLFGASIQGRDLSARVAARLNVPLAIDCIDMSFEGETAIFKRPIYAGKATATVKLTGSPVIASLRPNSFSVPEQGDGTTEVITINADVSDSDLGVEIVSVEIGSGDTIELTEADIIVSGGKGMKGPENFAMLEELAGILNAAVGASRSAVDSEWIDHSHQVGQTGKTVSPKIYIACGISGAIQHLAGMNSSKKIIAINKDPDAPIFDVADYGVVGDLFDVVPALVEELKKV